MTSPLITWKLLNEYGLDGAELESPGAGPPLARPSLFQRREDGSLLVVDERMFAKALPMGSECRTLSMRRNGEVLYDSWSEGIRDGYGCTMDNGLTALLRRSMWELLIVLPNGEVRDQLPLWNISKRMPWVMSWTRRKTFLIAFIDRVYETEIAEVDVRGRLLWHLPCVGPRIGNPNTVQVLENDNILIADNFAHVVLEVRRDGGLARQFGTSKAPGDSAHLLSSPASAREATNGRQVIADTRNHRVLVINSEGRLEKALGAELGLCAPTFAELLPDGHYLICDAGNGRVLELDAHGRIIWHHGNATAPTRSLSFPRSVESMAGGGILVADTANNRVVKIVDGTTRPLPFDDAVPLFWPRCARTMSAKSTLVADGRNGRVVEVSSQGKVLRQLDALDLPKHPRLRDPHDARALRDGRILVVDPSSDLVLITDWLGHVSWAAGVEGTVQLNDPHSAQLLDDGTILICDSGNHRLLLLDQSGNCVRCLESLRAGAEYFKFHRPRYAEIDRNGVLVAVDTGNNRVIAVGRHGEVLWVLSNVPESRIPAFDQPRWAHLCDISELLVCDHLNHRILRFGCETPR